MIFNTAKVVMAALTLGAMTTACSDWDDHYDANGTVTGSATSTLWENISANNDLTEFAALAKKVGYDKVLSNSQTYTVWAPLNGSFDYETLDKMDLATMKKQFMQMNSDLTLSEQRWSDIQSKAKVTRLRQMILKS